jgi:hypothetical protein
MEMNHLKLQQTTTGFEEINREFDRMAENCKLQSKLLVELLLLHQNDQPDQTDLVEEEQAVEDEQTEKKE